MQAELTQSNEDLSHQINRLQALLGQATIPGMLTGYRSEIEGECERLRLQVNRNLKDLSYNHPDTLENVLRQTQRVMNGLEVLNVLYVGPLLRSQQADELALTVLRWLHDEHPQTVSRSFALSDGQFAIYPHPDLPSVYYLPCSRQKTLLYLPLLFHEFGHLLYAVHKPEMDELVEDFQRVVFDVLAPMTVRRGSVAHAQDTFRNQVVLAYYEWLQEFFCDAVGLHIGGPAYLESFTSYFRLQGSREFYVPREDQLDRSHPVGWLRIRSLLHRAHQLGLGNVVDRCEHAWMQTANLMGINEDYEGTWSDELFTPLQRTLDDMLEETAPREHREHEIRPTESEIDRCSSPVALVNFAWSRFHHDSATYATFEKAAMKTFCDT